MPILPPRTLSETAHTGASTPLAALEARQILTSTLLAEPSKSPQQQLQTNQPASSSATERRDSLEPTAIPMSRVPRVLVVDDNKINLQLLVTFMKKAKFDYAGASDGLEALNAYKDRSEVLIRDQSNTKPRSAFDYVLMDINMFVYIMTPHLSIALIHLLTGLFSTV